MLTAEQKWNRLRFRLQDLRNYGLKVPGYDTSIYAETLGYMRELDEEEEITKADENTLIANKG